MDANPNPMNKKSGLFLNEAFLENSSIHSNLSQEVIITTSDKLMLALLEHKKYIKNESDWIPPVTIFLTIILVLVSADFKAFWGISADSWRSFFIIITIGSIIWSFITLYKAFKYREEGDLNKLILRLKKDSLKQKE